MGGIDCLTTLCSQRKDGNSTPAMEYVSHAKHYQAEYIDENSDNDDNEYYELDHQSSTPMQVMSKKPRVKHFPEHSKQNMQDAIAAVNAGSTFSEASRQYSVPRKTLSDHVKGLHQKSRGRKPVLDVSTEAELTKWISDCAALGDPRTPRQFLKAAGKLGAMNSSTNSFKNETPSRVFIKSFKKRNPEVRSRTPQALSRASANVTSSDVQGRINNIRSYLIDNGFQHILDDPKAFGNGDETGYQLNPVPKTVLAPSKSKAYRVENSKPKENVTVFNVILASGEALTPQIIHKESDATMFDVARACGEVGVNFVLMRTEKGWQTKDSFYNYVTSKFVEELDSLGVIRRADYPFVLLLDNHSSHIDHKLFSWCLKHHIIVATFFPNSTHMCQPLDFGVFGAAKTVYSRLVEDWKDLHANREKLDFFNSAS